MNLLYSPATIVTLLVLCSCITRQIKAAKGKGGRQGHIVVQNEVKGHNLLPIYMPIPIPIPMPMGAQSVVEPKYHSNHEADGEVKKIYLLQPMPKIQPHQSHSKAFLGPMQTHIHLPSSVTSQQRSRTGTKINHSPYDSDASDQSDSAYSMKQPSSAKSFSDLKILPIVVIPPIAPMNPIQVPEHSKSSHSGIRTNYLQDEKTFADYGGSGGGALYKEMFGSRSRLRSRHIRPASKMHSSDFGSASRLNSHRANQQDMMGFDGVGTLPRDHLERRKPGLRSGGPSIKRRSHHDSQHYRLNSIRDIMDQQSLFDDEPYDESQIEQARSSGKSECCHNKGSPRSFDFIPEASMSSFSSEQDDRDYLERRHPSTGYHRKNPSNSLDNRDEHIDRDIHSKQNDMNALFYDTDMRGDFGSGSKPSSYGQSAGRRIYSDNHDLMDDDEWRFDTIKSVKHVSPDTNVTSNVTTMETLTNLSLPIGTTLPPNLVKTQT